MSQPPTFHNVHDGVPNLRGGISETTKWVLGFVVALAVALSTPISTLVKSTQNDNWAQNTREMAALREEVHLLKQAQDNHISVESEHYGELKDLLKKAKK